MPTSIQDWGQIEKDFRVRWNFPNCYGAIDGKHFQIQAPPNSGSLFYNYKGFSSIILLALADGNYCFTFIDVGANGMASDGGVFNNSSLKTALENDFLPDGGLIVGDDAFPLKPYLLKPYSRMQNLTEGQKIFNYRVSRARRIVENVFGILVSRFRIFQKPISIDVDKADKLIIAACTLHNWLRKSCSTSYTPSNTFDFEDVENYRITPGNWRAENLNIQGIRCNSNRYSDEAKDIRNQYQHYFLNEGAVPWQARMIK